MKKHSFTIHLSKDSEILDEYLLLYLEPNKDFLEYQTDSIDRKILIPIDISSYFETKIESVVERYNKDNPFELQHIIYYCTKMESTESVLPKKGDQLIVI